MQDRNLGYRIEGNTALKMPQRTSLARIIDFPAPSQVYASHSASRISQPDCGQRVGVGTRQTSPAQTRVRESEASNRFTRKESIFLISLFGLLCFVVSMF